MKIVLITKQTTSPYKDYSAIRVKMAHLIDSEIAVFHQHLSVQTVFLHSYRLTYIT